MKGLWLFPTVHHLHRFPHSFLPVPSSPQPLSYHPSPVKPLRLGTLTRWLAAPRGSLPRTGNNPKPAGPWNVSAARAAA